MDINTLEEKLGIANLSDAEKLALVKGIESNVQASKAAVKAQEAGQYASLVVDAIKRIKNDLETRFNELNGIIDVKANSLQDGKDGLQGAKGEKGDRGFDGTNGKDGYNGKDGIDGVDGKDGVGVRDAYIDFDGSLIIKLTDGTEINVGEVVPMDVAEKIKIIGNGGGTSQSVLDSLESLQDQINTLTGIDGELGTMAQQNANSVAITGGTINGTTVGATTPAAGTFTTLTATGQTSLGGAAGSEGLRVTTTPSAVNRLQIQGNTAGNLPILSAQGSDTDIGISYLTKGIGSHFFFGPAVPAFQINSQSSNANYGIFTSTSTGVSPLLQTAGTDTNIDFRLRTKGTGAYQFDTGSNANTQFRVANTASAVNYVQVTGAATGNAPTISAQGSDANARLVLTSKGGSAVDIYTNAAASIQARFAATGNGTNYLQFGGANASGAPSVSAQGTDTNIDLALTPKGTGNVRFGTYTANMALVIQGYVEIKDSGGTVRKLAVIA
jgi:hypothetical protein